MKKPLRISVLAAGLAAASALMFCAAPAMAEVRVGINIGVPNVYVEPAPVYYAPRPVYVEPRTVYVQPRTYLQPQPVYVEEQYLRYGYRRHDRGRHLGHRDRDHDGVPDRFDRYPNNPYRY